MKKKLEFIREYQTSYFSTDYSLEGFDALFDLPIDCNNERFIYNLLVSSLSDNPFTFKGCNGESVLFDYHLDDDVDNLIDYVKNTIRDIEKYISYTFLYRSEFDYIDYVINYSTNKNIVYVELPYLLWDLEIIKEELMGALSPAYDGNEKENKLYRLLSKRYYSFK